MRWKFFKWKESGDVAIKPLIHTNGSKALYTTHEVDVGTFRTGWNNKNGAIYISLDHPEWRELFQSVCRLRWNNFCHPTENAIGKSQGIFIHRHDNLNIFLFVYDHAMWMKWMTRFFCERMRHNFFLEILDFILHWIIRLLIFSCIWNQFQLHFQSPALWYSIGL